MMTNETTETTETTETKQKMSKITEDASKFWEFSKNNEMVRELSHWHGVGAWQDTTEWESIGKYSLGLYTKMCAATNHRRPLGSMMEWGCGGGSNAVAFFDETKQFVGVDISVSNLEECTRQLHSRKLLKSSSFVPIIIDIENPKIALESLSEPVDFFLSTSVFQHFPSKDYGREITAIAHRALADDGIALIQTRYDDGDKENRAKDHNYIENVFRFTTYTIEEYWDIAQEAGFTPVDVVLHPKSKYAFYSLKKS